jgi:hypothetical protein
MKKSKNRVSPETVARRLQQALARFPDPSEKQLRRADTKGHLIEALRGTLRDAIRQRGCSLADLVVLLRESGLTVHPSTLKRHLGPVGDDREAYRRARSTSPPPPDRQAAGPAGQPATGARAVPVREADPGARPAAAAAAPAGAPDRSEAVLAAAPTPAPASSAPASSASAHSHLNLTSRFVPAPELPYDELIRQAEARKAQEAQ